MDLRLAQLSARAYEEYSVKAGGSKALVDETETELLIACRGTSDVDDVIRDLRTIPWRAFGTWVHRGFLVGGGGLYERLSDRIRTAALFEGKRIYLTGHSLGAAEATIIAALMQQDGLRAELVTFGSPRVGFKGLGKHLNNIPIRRYVYGNDAVTNVPGFLRWWWKHIGEEIKFDAEGCFGDGVKHHAIENYVAALAADGKNT